MQQQMRTYTVSVYHKINDDQLPLCTVYPDIYAQCFGAACIIGEIKAVTSAQTGIITKVEATLNK